MGRGRAPNPGQAGASLVEALVAVLILALVAAAAVELFQKSGAVLVISLRQDRQVKALNYAATEARATGSAPAEVEGYQISTSRRNGVAGVDARIAVHVTNSACQGDCNPDPLDAVRNASFITVTADPGFQGGRPRSLTVFRPEQ